MEARRSSIPRCGEEGPAWRAKLSDEEKHLGDQLRLFRRAGRRGGAPELIARYGEAPIQQADAIVALGGDGTMLQTLHRTMSAPKPVYGMHRGSIGFLINDFSERGPARPLGGGPAQLSTRC